MAAKKVVAFRAYQVDVDRIDIVKSYIHSITDLDTTDADVIRWALNMAEKYVKGLIVPLV